MVEQPNQWAINRYKATVTAASRWEDILPTEFPHKRDDPKKTGERTHIVINRFLHHLIRVIENEVIPRT